MFQGYSEEVRRTCSFVMKIAQHITIDQDKLHQLANELSQTQYQQFEDFDCHFSEHADPETIVNFLFVLDTLNFCFWPQENFEYDNLSSRIKKIALTDPTSLKPENLAKWQRSDLKDKIFDGLEFPLLDERYRLLLEVANVTLKLYEGSFLKIVEQAQHSCQKVEYYQIYNRQLLSILVSSFANFQDHAIYEGHQIFLFKRAQILIADLYAAFKGEGLGKFNDIQLLTTFPDYRVPQILNQLGVLKYSAELQQIIASKQIIQHGSVYEIEIRAATVVTVEMIKDYLKKYLPIEIDWLLWQMGEKQKDQIVNHHRTLSIFY